MTERGQDYTSDYQVFVEPNCFPEVKRALAALGSQIEQGNEVVVHVAAPHRFQTDSPQNDRFLKMLAGMEGVNFAVNLSHHGDGTRPDDYRIGQFMRIDPEDSLPWLAQLGRWAIDTGRVEVILSVCMLAYFLEVGLGEPREAGQTLLRDLKGLLTLMADRNDIFFEGDIQRIQGARIALADDCGPPPAAQN